MSDEYWKDRLRKKESTEEDLQYAIRYELASGIHTYHQCDCGRKKTRAGRCSICLEEELKRLEVGDE